MKEAIKNNKKFIIIGVVIIVLLLIGVAFAYLTTTLHGEKEYLVRAGSLGLKLEEGNELTLGSQIPIEDTEGMTLEGFNFSLVNEGNMDTDYTIYLDDISLDEGETRMPDSAIRYSLTKDSVVGDADNLSNMGTNPNRIVDSGSIESKQTINYTLRIWIDYDATLEEASGKTFKGKLRVEAKQSAGEAVSDVVLANVGDKGSTFDDGTDTFITGEDPNNYIWYSGKLWRAVSVNNEAETTKLVTQWNISAIPYNEENNAAFEDSHMKEWLNDTTVDGFLGNLRNADSFIKTDSKWNATTMTDASKPDETTIVESPIGLLNLYEYTTSCREPNYNDCYLNNNLIWWTLTPYNLSDNYYINYDGTYANFNMATPCGIRPSINLKSSVRIVSGDGTVGNPYRLKGDNDSNLSGTLLNTRYSGEYIKFGKDENNLYRIVSHETPGLTKIVSAKPLKENNLFKVMAFGDDEIYLSTNTIGSFLNNDYLDSNKNYLTSNDINMIEDNVTWYLGKVGNGENYKLSKYENYTDNILTSNTTKAKVGLLRLGELMSGQFIGYTTTPQVTSSYWLLTPYSSLRVWDSEDGGLANIYAPSELRSVSPTLNLKSNVIITGGDGTKEKAFDIAFQ